LRRKSVPSHAPSRLVLPAAAQVEQAPQHGVASNHRFKKGTIDMLRSMSDRMAKAYSEEAEAS
jgi:hypothetical protein